MSGAFREVMGAREDATETDALARVFAKLFAGGYSRTPGSGRPEVTNIPPRREGDLESIGQSVRRINVR